MGPYHQAVLAAFEEGVRNAARNHLAGGLDASTIDRHPVLIRALDALDGCASQDEASVVLSDLASECQDRAATDRGAPDWQETALVGGFLRDAAARVWSAPAQLPPPPVPEADGNQDGAPRLEWPSFAEPFEAGHGLSVEVASSTEDLMRYGRDLDNILQRPMVAESYGRLSVEGTRHVYAVLRDGRALSAGELRPKDGGVELVWNRGIRNTVPDPRTTIAVEGFVEAVASGALPGANAVEDGRFVDRAMSPQPSGLSR